MLKNFVRGDPKSLVDLRTALKIMDPDIDKNTRIISYCELMDYLLRSYATEEFLHAEVHDM